MRHLVPQREGLRRAWIATFGISAVLCLGAAGTAQSLFSSDVFKPTFNDGFILRVDTDGSHRRSVLETGDGLRGIAVDPVAGKIYWADVNERVIRRANVDGSDVEDLVTSGLAFPSGVVLDLASRKMYWGDQLLNRISCANLDGSSATLLLSTPSGSGLAFDSMNRKLYWTTALTSSTGEIRRSDADGSNEEIVVSIEKPISVAVDPIGGKIYWTDIVADDVRRADLDGTNVEDLFLANDTPNGIALDVRGGKVYWSQSTSPNRTNIKRMNLDGSNPEDVSLGHGNVGWISFVAALCLSRNGSSINPTGFACVSTAQAGAEWEASIDVLPSVGSAVAATVIAMSLDGPASRLLPGGFELLIHSPRYFHVSTGATLGTHCLAIPPLLAGRYVWTQGLRLEETAGETVLVALNALDLEIGL